jgi:hypothetical protein
MRYTLLIYTNEADRPEWGTPEGDAEAKGYNEFRLFSCFRGLLSRGYVTARRSLSTVPAV